MKCRQLTFLQTSRTISINSIFTQHVTFRWRPYREAEWTVVLARRLVSLWPQFKSRVSTFGRMKPLDIFYRGPGWYEEIFLRRPWENFKIKHVFEAIPCSLSQPNIGAWTWSQHKKHEVVTHTWFCRNVLYQHLFWRLGRCVHTYIKQLLRRWRVGHNQVLHHSPPSVHKRITSSWKRAAKGLKIRTQISVLLFLDIIEN